MCRFFSVQIPCQTPQHSFIIPKTPRKDRLFCREFYAMEWTVALIPPEFSTLPPEAPPQATVPDSAWRSQTDDLRPIECVVWGTGTPEHPMELFVRVGSRMKAPPEGEVVPAFTEPRMPTFAEVCSAIDRASLKGSVFTLGFYTSKGFALEPEPLPEGARWVGMQVAQAGFAEGSEAARRSLILTPGGLDHAN